MALITYLVEDNPVIRENLVDTRLLVERAGMLSEPEAVRERVRSYIERCRNDAAKAL